MFGTSGVRGEVGSDVTADLALSMGRALASVGYRRIVVGRDTRESGEMLVNALSAGLCECGADVVDVGIAATPTVARSVGWLDADAGVVITASHNPPKDNGLKLWNPSGQAFDADQRTVIADTIENEAYSFASAADVGTTRYWEERNERHVAALRDACSAVDDVHVAVDIGNGAGVVTATALRELGATVSTLNAVPDGSFPARPSEPTAQNCRALRQFVATSDADLGVAHDGDADRLVAVDEHGDFVMGDHLLALFARSVATAGDTVAAPLNTSLAVDDALASVGASVVRTKVGDVFVAERATDRDVVFGGEPSGAWIWPEETLCPDGPLAACRLVNLVDERGSLAGQLDGIGGYVTRRTNLSCDDSAAVIEEVHRRASKSYDGIEATDGIRVPVGDGWFLIRASGTQPLVRLTAEADDPGRADELLERARELITPSISQSD
ncbi:phosphoglucosamine mutase [Halobellus captivus]|uniref:phosphoglucosamine mutase n=1 Tax=Halobellus captivus TaxID=2592614 RepID=UPI0011A08154|nr:phosphoglucosamine mutase [Halobellus captivus]